MLELNDPNSKALLWSVPHICTLQASRWHLLSGVNYSPTALLHVLSVRWAPNRLSSVKDGEVACSPLYNTAQGTQ